MKTELDLQNIEKLEIPHLISELTAVVAVITDVSGNVIDSNKGFRYLLDFVNNDDEKIWNVCEFFIQPAFTELVATSKNSLQLVYKGILNIGDINHTCRSITGAAYRLNDNLLIIGEHDISDLERLSTMVIELNEDNAQTQRELLKTNRKLKRNEKQLNQLMRTDPMTGIANRRYFDEKVNDEVMRHKRYKQQLSFVMADIDLFKSVNDEYGHDVGDEVIIRFSHCMRDNIRDSDFVARVGGEEFIILMPQSQIEDAYVVIERLRDVFSQEHYDMINRKITASFGITTMQMDDTVDTLTKRADDALYQAKQSGRNRVSLDPVVS